MIEFKISGTDSAGNRFVLETTERACRAIELLMAIEERKLPIRDVQVHGPDGKEVDRVSLQQMAKFEAQGTDLLQRAIGAAKSHDEAT